MKSIYFSLSVMVFLIVSACRENAKERELTAVIANGQMPNIVKDNNGDVHIVYGYGDSIMHAMSNDKGKSFKIPELIAILPKLVASHTRGPQIASSETGITVIACNTLGNIFSYTKDKSGKWQPGARLNDVDTVAKEGLMALAGDNETLFAVWLDLRDKHNKIVGAKSLDGGKSWSTNIPVYASPDTTVCECCKPSVAVKGNNVYVMFRNWLDGNRDMYLIESSDGGRTFGEAIKLGNSSWALNGCPMDGGGLAISNNNVPQTIWRRQGTLYTCEPGKQEEDIGNGRNPSIESVNGKNVYTWTDKGEVVIRVSHGKQKNFGKGELPIIKAIDNDHIICVWENEKKIHSAILEL